MRHLLPSRGRPSLLTKFALVSLLPIALLGFGLSQYLEHQVRARAYADARQSAVLVATALQTQLTPYEFRYGLGQSDLIALDRTIAGLKASGVTSVKLWDGRGRVLYADDRTSIGHAFRPSPRLHRALDGRVAAGMSAGDWSGRVYEVVVPLRFGTSGRILGALELYLPYAPIQAAVADDVRTTYAFIASGLLLLWVSIFRLVAGASRKLRRQAEENERLALHDHLTGLPNRSLFLDRVEHALRGSARTGGGLGVLLMDLDRFKEVNDTLGHHCGDLMLKEVARRLAVVVRPTDTVARLGGDEFALLVPNLTHAEGGVVLAERISRALQDPFVIDGLPLEAEASVGIALHPQHGDDVETLLQRADVAMYVAKETKTHYAVYDADVDNYRPERLMLVGELRRAIENGELVLHYQPKATLVDGTVRGVEALVRWQHPERGLVPPDVFIPVAEHTGLIRPLTLFVVEEALKQCRRWREEGFELTVAVNVAMRNILDEEFPEELGRMLRKYDLDPEVLELELTETSVLADPPRAKEILQRLRDAGVSLAVDDFGTGYASLAYLSELPVDEIKIDRSFVMAMDREEQHARIVRSTIDLGRNLDLSVVAEGVESAAVWERLVELGCDSAQGYFLTKPLPASELTAWLDSRLPRRDLTAEAV
ncbi:MAG TPA: EAL domain-containing protein [Gaiellaceae bacterium]|nr:EAL domain-containing protein [Gaiellaceae bacterium]